MFEKLGAPSISASGARLHLDKLYEENMEKMRNIFENKSSYLIVDESEVKQTKYFNIMAATIEDPNKIYLLDCLPLDKSMNSGMVKSLVLDSLESMNMKSENIPLIISDAARYMVKGVADLKPNMPNLIHVHCVAHLMHNCAMRIKAHYKDIDYLISAIKGITVKNKTNRLLFEGFGVPPTVIVTRWSSWLRAVEYYCTHLPQIKNIVGGIQDDGVLIKNAKEALSDENLFKNLCEVYKNYYVLVEILDGFESSKYDIDSAYKTLENLVFKDDPLNLTSYIKSRLSINGISIIGNLTNENITPVEYCRLSKCPPTSIAVERSFSMLNKLLAKIVILYLAMLENIYSFITTAKY